MDKKTGNLPFPLQEPEMQALYAQLNHAMKREDVDAYSENIFGSFLVDIAAGRGLTTLSRHLAKILLNSHYFHADGMLPLAEVPQEATPEGLLDAFYNELDAVRRFGRFRGMMVLDLSSVSDNSGDAFRQFVNHLAEYREDVIFVFRSDPSRAGQFTSLQHQLSRKLLLRSVKIAEKGNEHYHQKILEALKSNQITCPAEHSGRLFKIVDTAREGATFAGFPTVLLIANEIAVCAQDTGELTITSEVLDRYVASETFAAHSQKAGDSKKIGF